MNFQAVSVGQKLIEPGVGTGGYSDAAGTPSALLKDEIVFVDGSIAQMVEELNRKHLLNSTLIIITAKHGQSPMTRPWSIRTRSIRRPTCLPACFPPRKPATRLRLRMTFLCCG